MDIYLKLFIFIVFVIIIIYSVYDIGRCKGRIEAFEEAKEQLKRLKKVKEKEKSQNANANLIARAPVLYDLLNSLLNDKVYNLDQQTRENIAYELKKARGE